MTIARHLGSWIALARPILVGLPVLGACSASAPSASGTGGMVAAGGAGGSGGHSTVPSTSGVPGLGGGPTLIDPVGDASKLPGPACAHADVRFERVVPTVWLMIDASGSMNAPLQVGASRYQLVREALLAPSTGLVFQLESLVRFGLYLYDGCAPGAIGIGCLAGACPRVVLVEPALDNFPPIDTSYPVLPPGSSTPTDVALAALAEHIGASVTPARPALPSYVVLATDGEPNICDWHDGIPSNDFFRQNAVDAVTRMVDSGTKVFAISLAQDPALQAYLARVAQAGGTGKPPFTPATKEELVASLRTILGGAVSCEVKLTGEIQQGKECTGVVTVGGAALPCNAADGWRAKDASTVELTGSACDSLRENPTSNIHVSFPCDVYRPIR